MRLRLTRRALADLHDIGAYIDTRSPMAARQVRRDLDDAFRLLIAHPEACRAYKHGRRRFSLRQFPYLVYYRVDMAALQLIVLTIRHGARRPLM